VRCPYCGTNEDRVVETRVADDGAAIRRRRECAACGRRFTTFERVSEQRTMVRKRSGVREPFDREKLRRGVLAALKNRPVGALEVERLLGDVEETVRGLDEVDSSEIGMRVLEGLRELDEVAYVRFASVYENFSGAEDFLRVVDSLGRPRLTKLHPHVRGGPDYDQSYRHG